MSDAIGPRRNQLVAMFVEPLGPQILLHTRRQVENEPHKALEVFLSFGVQSGVIQLHEALGLLGIDPPGANSMPTEFFMAYGPGVCQHRFIHVPAAENNSGIWKLFFESVYTAIIIIGDKQA